MSHERNLKLSASSVKTDHDLASFEAAIVQGGLPRALQFLNARTTFRYTAVYRIEGRFIRNLCLYDRLGKDQSNKERVLLSDSFCQFVTANAGFETRDSANDSRLDGQHFQGVLNAYFGMPLSACPGTIYGTLCHFDPEPNQIDDSEVPFLEAICPLLMARLPEDCNPPQ